MVDSNTVAPSLDMGCCDVSLVTYTKSNWCRQHNHTEQWRGFSSLRDGALRRLGVVHQSMFLFELQVDGDRQYRGEVSFARHFLRSLVVVPWLLVGVKLFFRHGLHTSVLCFCGLPAAFLLRRRGTRSAGPEERKETPQITE